MMKKLCYSQRNVDSFTTLISMHKSSFAIVCGGSSSNLKLSIFEYSV